MCVVPRVMCSGAQFQELLPVLGGVCSSSCHVLGCSVSIIIASS